MSQQGGKLEHQPTAEGSNRRVDRLNKDVFAMELTQQMDIVSRARDGVGILGVGQLAPGNALCLLTSSRLVESKRIHPISITSAESLVT